MESNENTPGTHTKPFLSLITDYGPGSSSCGYCGVKEDVSWSYGMHAEFMTVETYQALLDRGWRRSGRWIYKPLHARTCCQLITIRLDVDKFQPNNDQRKVIRKWEAYLAGAPLRKCNATKAMDERDSFQMAGEEIPQGASPKRTREESDDLDSWGVNERELQGGKRQRSTANLVAMDEDNNKEEELDRTASPTAELTEQLQIALGDHQYTDGSSLSLQQNHVTHSSAHIEQQQPIDNHRVGGTHGSTPTKNINNVCSQLVKELRDAISRCVENGKLPDLKYPLPKVGPLTPKQRRKLPLDIAYTSPTPLAVVGVANRAENGGDKEKKLSPRGQSATESLDVEGTAKALLDNMNLPEGITGAEVANGYLNFKADTQFVSHSHEKGRSSSKQSSQTTEDGKKNTSSLSRIPRSPPRHFELIMKPSSDSMLPAVEFELYKKYQVIHHKDNPGSVTKSSFIRFLCDSPLVNVDGYGSFHQQYWLDGRLIAVGVIDILPQALSSKYLFWDPDLASLSLGKLASLKEIDWVKNARTLSPSLKYYYLGFYLHTCHRMKYKAEFNPSDLLCPTKQCWVPIDRVRSTLDAGHRMPALADVPGVLEGLGEDYLVDREGNPAIPPEMPSREDVDEVKLFVGVDTGATMSSRRKFQIVTFGALRGLNVFPQDVEAHLERRLKQWMLLVGPAWRNIVYRFE